MKPIQSVISTLLFLVFFSVVHSQNNGRRYVRFVDRAKDMETVKFQDIQPTPKAERLSSSKGEIHLNYDQNLPDSIKTALNVATEIWSAKIPTKIPIYVEIYFESLDSDILMLTDVSLIESAPYTGMPSSLAAQILQTEYGTFDSPDGYIILNSDIKWNCAFASDLGLEYNITTMTLRGIARVLGFGSSIQDYGNDEYYYYFSFPSYFDNLLHNDNIFCHELQEGSQEMASFVKGGNVYIDTETSRYKIYAPSLFKQDESLCYFDNNNSLMSHSLKDGDVALSVDYATIDVLKTLGWDIKDDRVAIKCGDVSENGIGSSYCEHTFKLQDHQEVLKSYNWKYYLKVSKDEYNLISTGSDSDFVIPAVSNPDELYINEEGDFEGKVECVFHTEQGEKTAKLFYLSLEQKPFIISIDDIKRTDYDKYGFSLDFSVRYKGAEKIFVEVEEEYSTMVASYRFDEPYIAHVKTGKMLSLGYTWVTVYTYNKYGETEEFFEIEPRYDISISHFCDSTFKSNDIKEVGIYNLAGTCLYYGDNNYCSNCLVPGVYLKKIIYKDGHVETFKIPIK